MPRAPKTFRLAALLTAAVLSAVAAPARVATPSAEPSAKPATGDSPCPIDDAGLVERYRLFLDEVALLIGEGEKAVFLCLSEDYQRDAFIEEFWKARDPYPETARNEKREQWALRLAQVRQLFGDPADVRARFYLINGPPPMRFEICPQRSSTDIEAWYYGFAHMPQVLDALRHRRLRPDQHAVVFHRRSRQQPWKLWLPGDRLSVLDGRGVTPGLGAGCKREELVNAIEVVLLLQALSGELSFAYEQLMNTKLEPPRPVSAEWAATFGSYSTDVPEDAPRLDVELSVSYPSRRGSRTLVQIVGGVEAASATRGELFGKGLYAFELTGEVLRASVQGESVGEAREELFESFRYRFEASDEQLGGERMPLVAQRYLRPGSYRLILRIDDLHGDGEWRQSRALDVPSQPGLPPADLDPVIAVADRALRSVEPTIRIVVPDRDLISGFHRFDTATTGDIDHVVFSLDGHVLLTKRRPPFSVDLDIGHLPRARMLRATAFDSDGAEVASDAYLLNGSPHRFAVRIVDPIAGSRHQGRVRLRAQVTVPEGRRCERVEVYRGDELVATLFQEPWTVPVDLAGPARLTVLGVVAHLDDGATTEDTVILNGPAAVSEMMDEMQVDLVELYVTVTDKKRRPIRDLEATSFRVLEDGVEQTVRRFEHLDSSPLRITLMLDVSASMEPRLAEATRAAARFIEQLVGERDELSVVTFNDRPQLVTPFTRDRGDLARGLLGLRAERGTALYDSLIFTLYHLNGLEGQRAVLLLSDGVDETSRYTFEDALEYARRSRAAVYAIGIALKSEGKASPRKVLSQIAAETGGTAYFVDDAGGLDAVYAEIASELRSKYLLAYQSSNESGDDDSRRIEVEVAVPGAEGRTLQGYFP